MSGRNMKGFQPWPDGYAPFPFPAGDAPTVGLERTGNIDCLCSR
jgi:hypothetical protein